MLKMRNNLSNLSEKSAEWATNGWSFIPLNGDLLNGHEKAPALPNWKQFQQRRPTPTERQQWFDTHQFSAAGIILGKISGIVVIDIDDPQTARTFAHAMPDLTRTFTVQSGNRGLPHYYYAIDGQTTVPNLRTRQIELRSDGAYVVAPDVVIQGKRWRVINPATPHKLTQGDLSRLIAFIRLHTHDTPKNAKTRHFRPLEDKSLSRSELTNRYTHLAQQIGRNNALFNCGCYARDRGWTADQVTDALLAVHVAMPAPIQHPHQSPQSRQHEAMRTIASIYHAPPRPIYHVERAKQLPNAVREALLQRQKGCLARVLDALLMVGVRVGEWMSASRVMQLLQGVGIGRNTIYQALQVADVFTPQPPHADADTQAENHTKQCLFGSGTNRGQNQRGRPSAYFQMPSLERLCLWLGVQNRGGDQLTVADVRTATAYRRALYQAHIKRAPGAYTRHWQSQRLGVSPRTCRRYDRQCGIKVYPRYHETPIIWDNIDSALSDEPLMGRFLMDQTGRRYPEDRMLAKRLLALGRRLSLMVQGANYYQVEAPALAVQSAESAPPIQIGVPINPIVPRIKNVIVGIPMPATSAHLKAPKPTKHRADQPLWTHTPTRLNQAVVDRLYHTLRDLDPDQSITKKTARAWTKTYGERAIKRALDVLNQRQKIVRNPAGFLKNLLRTNRTVVLRKNDPPIQKVPSDPSAVNGWERFLTSKYASIYANYEELVALANDE